jgi:hypothetical protein
MFNKPFTIHMDTSHQQLGAVILQDNHPIAFYSRKLKHVTQLQSMSSYLL